MGTLPNFLFFFSNLRNIPIRSVLCDLRFFNFLSYVPCCEQQVESNRLTFMFSLFIFSILSLPIFRYAFSMHIYEKRLSHGRTGWGRGWPESKLLFIPRPSCCEAFGSNLELNFQKSGGMALSFPTCKLLPIERGLLCVINVDWLQGTALDNLCASFKFTCWRCYHWKKFG